jgi:hypothetical protein
MRTKRTVGRKRRVTVGPRIGRTTALLDLDAEALPGEHEPQARLTGGDVDADWQRAEASGDEAVGGSVATPDQDVVDEIGRAVGIEFGDDEELRMSDDILRDRDRFRWHLERDAEDEAEGRHHHRRGAV